MWVSVGIKYEILKQIMTILLRDMQGRAVESKLSTNELVGELGY